jgi:hypothetical protein
MESKKHGSSRRENAQARPGLASMMHQGETKRDGDAALAGDTREVMHQGKTPKSPSPAGRLGSIMNQ